MIVVAALMLVITSNQENRLPPNANTEYMPSAPIALNVVHGIIYYLP